MPGTNTEGADRPVPLLLAGTVWLPLPRPKRFFVASRFFRRAPRVREVAATHVAVLAGCDGTHDPHGIAHALGVSIEEVERCLAWWRKEAPAALLFRPPDVALEHALHVRSAAGDVVTDWRTMRATSTSTAEFHRVHLADAHRNFDRYETTISYVLSEPHPLLEGQRYGARVADRSVDWDSVPLRVLEIGPGLGFLAAAFLDRVAEKAPRAYSRLSYTLLDLSPALIAEQRLALKNHLSRVQWIEGDVEAAALEIEGFDLILCNEMIADLTVDFADRERIRKREPRSHGERTILDYDLPCVNAPERFVVNAGAIELVERIAKALAPGGRAWTVEYGAPGVFPKAVELPGHVEYSIRFDHLQRVAERAGLQAHCEPLHRWLRIDDTVEVMRGDDGLAVAELLMPHIDLPQPSRPWLVTRERLRTWLGDAAAALGHRGFVPVTDADAGLSPATFYVLMLRRPDER